MQIQQAFFIADSDTETVKNEMALV